MLRIDNKQPDLLEGFLTEEMLELSEELAFVDQALDDPRVVRPFLKGAKKGGRPTIAVATYLRMMYLKRRYEMSYEVLVQEVSDSIKWRRFCHLPLTGKAPDDKTLIKLTKRYGEKAVRAVHDAVVRQAVKAKIIRGRKMRLDTTVTESNIHYPTDTGLLADGVRVITRTVRKIKEVVKLKTRFRNRVRSIKKRILRIAKFLGRKKGRREKLRKTKEEMLKIAQMVLAQALGVHQEICGRNVEISTESPIGVGALEGMRVELKHWVELLRVLIAQLRQVLGGNLHIPQRVVSIFDPGARPIQKGKLFPKTEFGRKVLIQEAEKGLVTDYQVREGNPVDPSFMDPAVDKHENIFGSVPKDVAADRGFYKPGQEEKLKDRGIKRVSIPVKGKRSGMRERTEKSSWFRGLQRWRAGGEAKISLLKRKFGLRRTRVRGDEATEAWIGWGCIINNLVIMARAGP